MNKIIPIVMVALALAFVPAYAEGSHSKHMVDNFVGTIPVPETMDKETHHAIKEQVTVSLSQAAQGLDVMMGKIGVAVNQDGEKFVVWVLTSYEMTDNTKTVTKHIVDAGDITNTATVTKEYKMDEYKKSKFAKLEQRLSESTGNAELDELHLKALDLIREMRQAHEDGDADKVKEIRDELRKLKEQMKDVRRA